MAPDTTRPITADALSQNEKDLNRIFALQKAAYAKNPYPDKQERTARLDSLIHALEKNEQKIIEAVNADFGNRAHVETLMSEIVISVAAAKLAKKSLGKWLRARRVATPLHMAPSKSRLEPQPLGVVGIIAPWNYPIQLALSPASAALAAGNRVMIKPSELTPITSQLLKEILSTEFDDSVLAVINGGVDVGRAFTNTPFDHLLFTGSTPVGHIVAEAAAKNLTPVTLELGGKSPAIIDASADLAKAAQSIAQGKAFNAGQTCVAPDYVMTLNNRLDDTVDAITAAARQLYPEIDTTTDYTSIISDRHFARLKELVEEARNAGAKIVEIGSANALHPQRKLPVTLVIDPPVQTGIMQEEIFGPILPILSINSHEDAITHINAGDRPLALYWYGEDTTARDDILKRTVSGGVTINDALWHVAQEHLPFGGVGKSGIGAYHGDAGFETFSHMKPIYYQSRFTNSTLLHPPYTDKTKKVINLIRKIM